MINGNLIGIHSLVTDFNLNKNSPKKYLEHTLLTQILSAWWWKKLNGPIHLYTTDYDAEFLEKIGILKLYDYVNTKVLTEEKHINWAEFKSVCKMKVAAEQQQYPFATIDTDLILRTPLNIYDLNDLTFLYTEIYLHKNHPSLNSLGKREGYEFPDFAKNQVDLINTSFLVWSNPQLVRDYWRFAYDYIKDNNGKNKEFNWANTSEWKHLYVKKLLTNLIEKDNYSTSSLFPLKYAEDTETWLNKGEPQNFLKFQNDIGFDFYHLWKEKTAFYDFRTPICTGNQIRILYQLIKAVNELHDIQLDEIIDEIIVFTIEKTYELGLNDLYELRIVNKHLLI